MSKPKIVTLSSTLQECFICAGQVFKTLPNLSLNFTQQQIQKEAEEAMNKFVLENVLDLPSDVKLELDVDGRANTPSITYCGQCLDHIKRIRIALEGLQKLEKHVLDMKFEIEVKLKESWEKRLENPSAETNEDNAVNQLKNSVTQGLTKNAMMTMLDKIGKKELGKQPRPNFKILKTVTVTRNPDLDAQAQKYSESVVQVLPKENNIAHSANSSSNTSPSQPLPVPGPSKRVKVERKSEEKEGQVNNNKKGTNSGNGSDSDGDSPGPKPKRQLRPRRSSARQITKPVILEDGDVSSSSDWSGAESAKRTRKRGRRDRPAKKLEKSEPVKGSDDEDDCPDISKFVDVVLAVKTEKDSDVEEVEIIDVPGAMPSNSIPKPMDVLTISDGFDYMSMYDGAPGKAIAGDVLVLTKPLGTELAVNAHQWMDMPDHWRMIGSAISEHEMHKAYLRGTDTRNRLNINAARLMVKYNAHAAIQMNERGLLYQANELAKNQIRDVSFVIHNLPVIAKMHALDKACGDLFQVRQGLSNETSGGLLIILPREEATNYCKEIEKEDGYPAWIIGLVEKGHKTARILDKPRLIDVPAKETDKLW